MLLEFYKEPVIKLYHKDIYLPNNLFSPAKQLIKSVDTGSAYAISGHVYDSLTGRGNGWSHQLDYVPFVRAFNQIKNEVDLDIFEIETRNGVVSKCVARTTYDPDTDISFVIRHGKIITAWLNMKEDQHYTLDWEKYEQDPNSSELFSEEDFADDLEFEEE